MYTYIIQGFLYVFQGVIKPFVNRHKKVSMTCLELGEGCQNGNCWTRTCKFGVQETPNHFFTIFPFSRKSLNFWNDWECRFRCSTQTGVFWSPTRKLTSQSICSSSMWRLQSSTDLPDCQSGSVSSILWCLEVSFNDHVLWLSSYIYNR